MADPADIVLAAVHAAGPAGTNPRAWRHRVLELVPEVAAFLRPAQYGAVEIAQHVTDSTAFPAEFISYEIEETSKRALLQLRTTVSKRYPEGIEPIRTYPSWSAVGYQQIRRVKTLKPGDRLFVYKAMEAKAGQSEGEQVRVLAHFEVLGPASSQGSSSPTPPAESVDAVPVAPTPAEGVDAPAPSSPAKSATSQGKAAVEEAMAGLTNSVKIKIARRCHAEGYTAWVDPDPELLPVILGLIEEVTTNP